MKMAERSRNFWENLPDLAKGLIWFGPLGGFLIIIFARALYAARFADSVVFDMFLGLMLGVVGIVLLVIALVRYRFMQLVMITITVILSVGVVLFWIGSLSRAFYLMLGITAYTDLWNGVVITDIVRSARRHEDFWRTRIAFPRGKTIATMIALGSIVACPLLVAVPWYAMPGPTHFTITDQQAKAYDLVLYYPEPERINADVCHIARAANATLSFNVHESSFYINSLDHASITNAVRVCNNYGVPVEIWPLFDIGYGYISYSYAGQLYRLYEAFHNWTIRENISVKYLLWDIEGAPVNGSCQQPPAWESNLGIFGYTGHSQFCRMTEQSNWSQAVADFHNVNQQANADGFTVRATTVPDIVWDTFTGDDTLQENWGLPAWDADGYQYVSMMLYRGCDGPGNNSNSFIFDCVRASAVAAFPGRAAACLGCINYGPYPDIPSVVNDVHLALAAGAWSVRLFQGCSWVFGTGGTPGYQNLDGYKNPPHYLNNTSTSGLYQLLQACRQGGNVTYYPDQSMRLTEFTSILEDVFSEFTIP